MKKPDYLVPSNLDQVLATLNKCGTDARIIAGGTDLLLRMRAGEIRPELLVDIGSLPLDYYIYEDNQIRLGACLTLTRILSFDILASNFPALVEACQEIAATPIRNRATLGGNLVNASPAADTAPPLLVYDAHAVLAKQGSQRIVSLGDFFCGPGETILSPDELLTEVRIPLMPPKTAAKFIKLGQRGAMAISVASVAIRLTLDEKDRVVQARIALGSVAPTPVRVKAAEALLEGHNLTEALILRAAKEASRATSPISDVRGSADYRRKMVAVLVRRAIKATFNRLIGGGHHSRNRGTHNGKRIHQESNH